MIIDPDDLFERFTLAHPQYSHLPPEELRSACNTQFEQIKKVMEGDVLGEIRLKYLFTVRVYKYRLVSQLTSTYLNYHKGYIKAENFKRYAIMMLDYVHKNPKKFIKYENKITGITGFNPEDIRQRIYLENPAKHLDSIYGPGGD